LSIFTTNLQIRSRLNTVEVST